MLFVVFSFPGVETIAAVAAYIQELYSVTIEYDPTHQGEGLGAHDELTGQTEKTD